MFSVWGFEFWVGLADVGRLVRFHGRKALKITRWPEPKTQNPKLKTDARSALALAPLVNLLRFIRFLNVSLTFFPITSQPPHA